MTKSASRSVLSSNNPRRHMYFIYTPPVFRRCIRRRSHFLGYSQCLRRFWRFDWEVVRPLQPEIEKSHCVYVLHSFNRFKRSGSRDKIFLATKFGIVRTSRRVDGTPEHVRSSCEESLRRLGVNQIDLYYFHVGFFCGRIPLVVFSYLIL
jgi:hypothetical protein